MPKQVEFTVREPIGSSTYPMPNDIVDYRQHLEQLNQKPTSKKTSTLYVHIPFCDQICSFCGFNKFVSTEDKKKNYVQSLIKEIQLYAQFPYVQALDIKAVYLGGGTPNSLLPEQLDQVLMALRENFPIGEDCEFTCEGTPQNFNDSMIAVLKKNGVQRVSAGVQTVNAAIRKEHLHMNHDESQVLTFINNIRNHFDNFNLDFIYNLPEQTKEIWAHDLEVALSAQSSHLTIYPLVLLEKTRFYTDYVKKNSKAIPSQEKELVYHAQLLERFQSSPFKPYTIRDWSLPNKECRYILWNARNSHVLALGAGSHGYISRATYRNERNLVKYGEMIEDGILPLERHKLCSEDELMQRFMVMGLRLFSLDMGSFSQHFEADWKKVFSKKIEDMIYSGYLTQDNSVLNYTPKGHIWANNVRTYFEGEKTLSVGYADSLGIGKSGKSHYESITRIKAAADVEAHQ